MTVSLISSRSTRGSRLGASIAAAIWLVLVPAAPAGAQTLARGTLKMVVPFAPGGPSDVAGRIVAAGLSEVLGRSVIVENPTGAGGTIGSLRVSRSTPDGSEFVLANSGTHVWSQALYKTARAGASSHPEQAPAIFHRLSARDCVSFCAILPDTAEK